jgi:hypothetical protein
MKTWNMNMQCKVVCYIGLLTLCCSHANVHVNRRDLLPAFRFIKPWNKLVWYTELVYFFLSTGNWRAQAYGGNYLKMKTKRTWSIAIARFVFSSWRRRTMFAWSGNFQGHVCAGRFTRPCIVHTEFWRIVYTQTQSSVKSIRKCKKIPI